MASSKALAVRSKVSVASLSSSRTSSRVLIPRRVSVASNRASVVRNKVSRQATRVRRTRIVVPSRSMVDSLSAETKVNRVEASSGDLVNSVTPTNGGSLHNKVARARVLATQLQMSLSPLTPMNDLEMAGRIVVRCTRTNLKGRIHQTTRTPLY